MCDGYGYRCIWIRDRRGEEGLRYTYYYIPTDEGTSFNLSLVSMKSLQLNIQYRSLIFGGREGSLVKHTKGEG